jgi:polar amino acid transport system substrate-binding protein
MMKKRTGIFLLVLALLALAVCATIFSRRDQSLVRLQKEGVITIGYAVEAPYVYLQKGGEVTGAEAEVARRVVSRLGIQRIEWRLIEFDQLIPELEAGRVDAIVAGMFITKERAKRVRFSEPTFHVTQGLLVTVGNPFGLHSYSQAAVSPNVKIAVLSGAVEEKLLIQLGAGQLVQVPDALTGRVAVETGMADGLALSMPTIRWFSLQDQLGRTELAQPFDQDGLAFEQSLGYGAVVFRQNDQQLCSAWNRALDAYLGTPEHLGLIAPFGFSADDLPGAVTTKEILSKP